MQTEVVREVDNLAVEVLGQFVHIAAALAVTHAEEDDVGRVDGGIGGESQCGLANQVVVGTPHRLASVALALGEQNVGPGVVYENAHQLTTCVASGAYYSYLNHNLLKTCNLRSCSFVCHFGVGRISLP